MNGEQAEFASALAIRQGAYLPHWTRTGAVYFVTFRLADSLPARVLRRWQAHRDHILARASQVGRPLTDSEQAQLSRLRSRRVERWLDRGAGECVLRDGRAASIVQRAMLHFHGDWYDLACWCVMPNHVHAVLHPRVGHALESILHSWKSFTAHEINKTIGRRGAVWQPEYYDHLIRDAQEHGHFVRYTLGNPAAAGLVGWPWVGRTGSC
jgi:hypothetical protein